MWSRFDQVPRVLLATFLAVGFATLWAIVVGVATDAIVSRLSGRAATEDILVRSDKIVIHRADQAANTYRFLDGRPVALEDVKQLGRWPMAGAGEFP
jgi:hypothetical protein